MKLDPKNRQPSMSEFKKLINYEQKYSLENGLKITYDWYLKNIFKNNKKHLYDTFECAYHWGNEIDFLKKQSKKLDINIWELQN